MLKSRQRLALVLLCILIFVPLSLLVPTPAGNSWLGFHAYFGIALLMTSFDVGASVLFLKSLSGFTPKLKRAFLVISTGMTLLGLAFLQSPASIAFGNLESYWKDTGVSALPYLAAFVILFTGTRKLAQLFDVHHITLKYRTPILASLASAIAVTALPSPPASSVLQFKAAVIMVLWSAIWVGLVAVHALLIKRAAGVLYTSTLAWLALGAIITVTSGLGYCVAVYILPESAWELILAASFVPNTIGNMLFLVAAHHFSRITETADVEEKSIARNFFGKPLQARRNDAASSVDIVIYAANLVSNPQAVDPALNQVRQVTARSEAGQSIQTKDQRQLMSAYLEIEHYLAADERVRNFTPERLRREIAQKLRLTDSSNQTFWSQLPAPTAQPTINAAASATA